VSQQVFEEAAVDLGRGLAAFTASRRGERPGPRVGFPRFKRKTSAVASFRLRNKTTRGRAGIRVGEARPEVGDLAPDRGVAGAGGHPPATPDAAYLWRTGSMPRGVCRQPMSQPNLIDCGRS
jgi:hypothetical protein